MEYTSRVMRISSLVIHRPYPIINAERVGDSLLISFLDSPEYISQRQLPHAGVYFLKEELTHINAWETFYTLAYRGRVGMSDYHLIDFVLEPVPMFLFESWIVQS
jgi:hypothetical protein